MRLLYREENTEHNITEWEISTPKIPAGKISTVVLERPTLKSENMGEKFDILISENLVTIESKELMIFTKINSYIYSCRFTEGNKGWDVLNMKACE